MMEQSPSQILPVTVPEGKGTLEGLETSTLNSLARSRHTTLSNHRGPANANLSWDPERKII